MNAGEGVRWNAEIRKRSGYPPLKQLCRVGPETVIARQFRQLRSRGIEPVLVTHRQELIDEAEAIYILVPAKRRWTVESLVSSKGFWGNRTVILLGDVVFTEPALDTVLGLNGEVRFFGWHGDYIKPREMYACTFGPHAARQVQEIVSEMVAEMETYPNFPRFAGKLQDLYGCMVLGGTSGFRGSGQVGPVPPIWVWICDWTDDIDSPISLQRVLPAIAESEGIEP